MVGIQIRMLPVTRKLPKKYGQFLLKVQVITYNRSRNSRVCSGRFVVSKCRTVERLGSFRRICVVDVVPILG